MGYHQREKVKFGQHCAAWIKYGTLTAAAEHVLAGSKYIGVFLNEMGGGELKAIFTLDDLDFVVFHTMVQRFYAFHMFRFFFSMQP